MMHKALSRWDSGKGKALKFKYIIKIQILLVTTQNSSHSYRECFKVKEFSESWITVCLDTLLSRDLLLTCNQSPGQKR